MLYVATCVNNIIRHRLVLESDYAEHCLDRLTSSKHASSWKCSFYPRVFDDCGDMELKPRSILLPFWLHLDIEQVSKLKTENFKPKEQVTLEPYERDHAVVIALYRPPKKAKNT